VLGRQPIFESGRDGSRHRSQGPGTRNRKSIEERLHPITQAWLLSTARESSGKRTVHGRLIVRKPEADIFLRQVVDQGERSIGTAARRRLVVSVCGDSKRASASAVSTMRPPSITAMRSAM